MHHKGPKYHLKGAASAAQQHYLPPNYRDLTEAKNLLIEYKGTYFCLLLVNFA